ncbi:MAG: thiamine pyrophosphate-binding protein [Chloroflexi bacterium]|nr:thiamine pyrophosphate-binding protein [Chloroflexota bacterium]
MPNQSEACRALIRAIEAIAPHFLIHIPDSTVAPVLEHFSAHPSIASFPVAREEEAVGVAAGIQLTGKRAVLLMQDTGLGNSLTALTTFSQAYHVPTLLIVVRRGGPGEINAAVHHLSDGVPGILQAAGIATFELSLAASAELWPRTIERAFHHAQVSHRPVVVLVDLKE